MLTTLTHNSNAFSINRITSNKRLIFKDSITTQEAMIGAQGTNSFVMKIQAMMTNHRPFLKTTTAINEMTTV